jgi:hypothetical protein
MNFQEICEGRTGTLISFILWLIFSTRTFLVSVTNCTVHSPFLSEISCSSTDLVSDAIQVKSLAEVFIQMRTVSPGYFLKMLDRYTLI